PAATSTTPVLIRPRFFLVMVPSPSRGRSRVHRAHGFLAPIISSFPADATPRARTDGVRAAPVELEHVARIPEGGEEGGDAARPRVDHVAAVADEDPPPVEAVLEPARPCAVAAAGLLQPDQRMRQADVRDPSRRLRRNAGDVED